MSKCIYCSEEKDEFTKEHVFPKSFGNFGETEKTWTLYKNEVCKECNSFLGRELDIEFARNSLEGVHRHMANIDVTSQYCRRDNLKATISKTFPNPGLHGAVVYFNPAQDKIDVVSQVGVLDENEKVLEFIPQDDFSYVDPNKFRKVKLRLIASNEERYELLLEAIKTVNPTFISEPVSYVPMDQKNGRILVDIKGEITVKIQRCISKIAMNFICFHLGKTFVLGNEFDKARKFIRFGEGGLYVVPSNELMIATETENMKALPDGYIITAEQSKDDILVRMRFFNFFTYSVRLEKIRFNKPFGYSWKPGFSPKALLVKPKNLYIATYDQLGNLIIR